MAAMPGTLRTADLLPLAAGLLLAVASCAAPAARREPAPPDEAVEAFARARGLRARGAGFGDPELGRALAEAGELAPDWVPPRRLEDDLLVAELRQVEALERRRTQRAQRPGDPGPAYLAARLEGGADTAAFEEALRVDRDFAWSLHGRAYGLSLTRADGALLREAWGAAMERAATPWEQAYMGHRLARTLQERGETADGVAVLDGLLEEPRLLAPDRAWLEAERAAMALRGADREGRRLAYETGLRLLREEPLDPGTARVLFGALAGADAASDPDRARLEGALAARDEPTRIGLRVELLVARGELASARALASLSEDPALVAWARERADLPGYGDRPAAAHGRWLAELPQQVLAEDGRPADPRLRRLEGLAREAEARAQEPAAWEALGGGLLDAGWYAEAESVAARLAELDPAAGLRLREAARAGTALVTALEPRLEEVELGLEPVAPGPARTASGGGLDDLLRRWAALAAEVSGEEDPTARIEAWCEAPRLGPGGLAELVHPGPRFSAADQRAGLGREGEPVPGLAAELDRRGRFAIVGRLFGQAPDAVVLRRLRVERRSGEHLGVPWSGTVVWGEGVDVRTRPQRAGLSIGGAALHEGYWIDLAEVRPVQRRWDELRRRFAGDAADPDARRRIELALGTRGLRLREGAGRPASRRRERRALVPTLGQADRVRLALLRERAAGGALLGEVTLEEVAGVMAIHEEGHLCDRTRFLPLAEHLPAALAFLLESGFAPRAIQERLEYRAELTALCEVPEPRLVLVDLLSAVDEDLSRLGHGPAYRRLLGDLVRLLDEEREQEPAAWPELSEEHTLVHQLHRIGPERLRELGRTLARREGLLRD